MRPARHPINPSCLPSAAGSQGHPRDSRGRRWAGSTSSSPRSLEAPPLLAACSPLPTGGEALAPLRSFLGSRSPDRTPQPQSAHPCRCPGKSHPTQLWAQTPPRWGRWATHPCPLPSQPWPHPAVKPLSLSAHTPAPRHPHEAEPRPKCRRRAAPGVAARSKLTGGDQGPPS